MLKSLVSRNFLVLLRYSFLTFSFISLHSILTTSNMARYLLFSFSKIVLTFPWLSSSIPSIVSPFTFFHSKLGRFFSTKFNSEILTVDSKSLSNGFYFLFILGKYIIIDIYAVVYLSRQLCKLVVSFDFLTIWFRGFVAITNISGNNVSPWMMPTWFVLQLIVFYPSFSLLSLWSSRLAEISWTFYNYYHNYL